MSDKHEDIKRMLELAYEHIEGDSDKVAMLLYADKRTGQVANLLAGTETDFFNMVIATLKNSPNLYKSFVQGVLEATRRIVMDDANTHHTKTHQAVPISRTEQILAATVAIRFLELIAKTNKDTVSLVVNMASIEEQLFYHTVMGVGANIKRGLHLALKRDKGLRLKLKEVIGNIEKEEAPLMN